MILMNLFSVFDPVSYFGISVNWLIILMVLGYLFINFHITESKLIYMNNHMFMLVKNIFMEVSGEKYLGLSIMSLMGFVFIVILNMLGLFPFIFSSTAHIFFTMGMGVVFWLSFFLMGWMKNFKNSAAHLVPEGSPIMLSFLMVLIESISHLMRPFTLSIRLAANIMAGHLIVGLLSSISLMSFFGMISSLFLQSILLILEFGVALIQGFVFSILLILYSLEYY